MFQQNPLPRNKLPQQGGWWRNRTRAGLDDKLYFWKWCRGKKKKEKGEGKKAVLCLQVVIWSILSAGTMTPSVTNLHLLFHASLLTAWDGVSLAKFTRQRIKLGLQEEEQLFSFHIAALISLPSGVSFAWSNGPPRDVGSAQKFPTTWHPHRASPPHELSTGFQQSPQTCTPIRGQAPRLVALIESSD